MMISELYNIIDTEDDKYSFITDYQNVIFKGFRDWTRCNREITRGCVTCRKINMFSKKKKCLPKCDYKENDDYYIWWVSDLILKMYKELLNMDRDLFILKEVSNYYHLRIDRIRHDGRFCLHKDFDLETYDEKRYKLLMIKVSKLIRTKYITQGFEKIENDPASLSRKDLIKLVESKAFKKVYDFYIDYKCYEYIPSISQVTELIKSKINYLDFCDRNFTKRI